MTLNNYIKTVKELYKAGGKADKYSLYIVIYKTIYNIYKEQRNIINSGTNLSVLLSTLGALSYLTKIGLSFYEVIESNNALLLSLTLNIVVAEEFYKYYI